MTAVEHQKRASPPERHSPRWRPQFSLKALFLTMCGIGAAVQGVMNWREPENKRLVSMEEGHHDQEVRAARSRIIRARNAVAFADIMNDLQRSCSSGDATNIREALQCILEMPTRDIPPSVAYSDLLPTAKAALETEGGTMDIAAIGRELENYWANQRVGEPDSSTHRNLRELFDIQRGTPAYDGARPHTVSLKDAGTTAEEIRYLLTRAYRQLQSQSHAANPEEREEWEQAMRECEETARLFGNLPGRHCKDTSDRNQGRMSRM